jgi:hypothetical protein
METDGRTDRQTDMKLTASIRNFAKAPKNFQRQRLQVHYFVASPVMKWCRFAGDYEYFEETCGSTFRGIQKYLYKRERQEEVL